MPRRIAGPCPSPGCPNREGSCTTHKRGPRESRQARGYDADHDRLRAWWQRKLDAGQTIRCWRCKTRIDPTNWRLGHDDHDRSKYRGPECTPCNQATAARRGGG